LGLIRESSNFEQLRGVAEYLVLISESKQFHPLLCATLARAGSYEVLLNVLPKLQDNGSWVEDALAVCVETVNAADRRRGVKHATGWRSLLDAVERTIREATPQTLLTTLLPEGSHGTGR
jgi:hypothetical protein